MNGRAWTKEEDTILRDAFERGVLIAEIAQMCGRTVESVKCHATRLGIMHKGFVPWTPEEDEILREIWMAPLTVKAGLHRLPGRSYEGAKQRAKRLGYGAKVASAVGTRSYALRALIAMLDGVSMTAKEIAAATGMDEGNIYDTLMRWRGVEFRISAWERVDRHHFARKWTLGAEEDAPKPAPREMKELHKNYRERKRIAKGIFNPFAAAAGMIEPPKAPSGRVFKQSMEIRELEEA